MVYRACSFRHPRRLHLGATLKEQNDVVLRTELFGDKVGGRHRERENV
jgi:hypothetical protein